MANASATTRPGEVTVLTNATSKSQSLRSTVPIGIVRQLALREGDRLVWELRPYGNQLVVVVSPIRDDQNAGEVSKKQKRK